MTTPGTDHVRRVHERRLALYEHVAPELDATPELADAWRSLQLHWLHTVPGYRELVRQRVASAAIRAERFSRRIDAQYADVDYLGREVEGCG